MAPAAPRTQSGDEVLAAFETSTRPGSVALWVGRAVATRDLGRDASHAADLLPELGALLAEAGRAPSELTGLCIGTGPGSFTGLRVGIATALGLARATGAVLVGVPSVEALAFAELAVGEEGVVLLDARSHQVYLAHYAREEDGVRVLRAPEVVALDDVRDRLPRGVPLLGEPGTAALLGLEDPPADELRITAAPSAAAVLALGRARLERGERDTPEQVEPLYLRAFAAKQRKR